MFLRSLTLRGFKSFADKTTLEFTPGISVVVGPNGSGKSNIVDAIAWVLGEQGPRALRGGHMSDVIFAGSPARPALGMAEVKMVIDNSAGLIPVPASEIEISRAVFRSGDSEYRLGDRPCRLLDIQELLSDTGMGRAQHTIVGQGQLDSILAARPEERRQFIEEAAGIAKHRRRRERADRKLAGLEQDLLRLQDLVAELRRQLKPLEHQAELAQRHEALTREAADLARKLAAARLRELYRDRDAGAPAWETAERQEAEAQAKLNELDERIARLDRLVTEAQDRHGNAEKALDRSSRVKSDAEDAVRAAIREEARAQGRVAAAADRSGRLFAIEDELARTESALVEIRAQVHRREKELAEAERAFRAAEDRRRDAEAERRRLESEQAGVLAKADAIRRSLAGHEAETRRLASLLAGLDRRRGEATGRADELEQKIERLDAMETPLAAELGRLEGERADLARAVAELEAQEQGLLARREVAEARRSELSESPGAAFVRGRGERSIGVLGDLIEVPADLRPGLKAALGSLADAVVYERRQDAIEAITSPGALGLTLAVAQSSELHQAALPRERHLLDAIRPDPRIAGLLGRLLRETYVVQNAAEAAAKSRMHPSARFVSMDGVLIGPEFVRTAPGHDARFEQARRDYAAVERELAGVHSRLRDGHMRLQEIAAREAVLRSALEESDQAIATAADEQSGLQATIASIRSEQQMVADRLAAAESAAAAARDDLDAVASGPVDLPAMPPIPEPPMHLRVETEALRRERARLEAGVARARREAASLAAEDGGTLQGALEEAEAARLRAEEHLGEAVQDLADAQALYRASGEELRRVQGQHAEANRSWREGVAAIEAMRREHEEGARARHDLARRIADAERLLREGHGADPREAVDGLEAEESVEELGRRSDAVARRIGLIGRVNLLAVGELEALRERHDFLVRELADVRAARRDLEQVIEEVDDRMSQMFEDAFRDVAAQFAALFGTMFPGGEGRLVLTDQSDPLNAGIELEARPGRGKVKRLSLLSGGERSLAALAFLFAIFRARPSPFYLMDEVEAALDDINLHRFLEVVKEFARMSQILVVTHQKRTMETADVLYGISMGRDGASTVISQRLLEVAAR